MKIYEAILLTVALVGVSAPASAAPLPENFTLGRYVPGDCWLYVHGVDNPEAQFIEDHWIRVFVAVRDCGVGQALKDVFTDELTDEKDLESFNAFWSRTGELVSAVKWGDLLGREFVFAERMSGPMLLPDFIFLCRPTAETREENHRGLVAILDSLAGLSESVTVADQTVQGVPVRSLSIQNVPITVHVFRKDEVIGVIMGPRAVQEVLSLLNDGKGPTPIVSNPRFQKALAEVPPPEDVVTFFDVRRLMCDIQDGCRQLVPGSPPGAQAMAAAHAGTTKPAEDHAAQTVVKLLQAGDVFDYIIGTQQTDGLQQITHSVVRLQAEYRDRPLGRILASQKQIERFDRYIPVDATAFSVSSGPDWAVAYREAREFVKSTIPGGAGLLARWDEFQQSIGLNMEADVLSWLDQEIISVQLPASFVSPFGATSENVWFVRTKDPALAKQKVFSAMDRGNEFVQQIIGQPLLITPAEDVQAEGFRSVTHPALALLVRLVVGVHDGWLIIGSSDRAVNKCLDCAAGKGKTILENPRFLAEGVRPTGAVTSVSFQDLSGLGQELAQLFGVLGFASMGMPDDPGARPVKARLNAAMKLGPALAQIDFLSSSASATTFDGQAWTVRQVTTYKPAKPAPATAPTPASPAATPATAAPAQQP